MKKDANSNTEISPQSWLRLHAVWLMGFIALLLLGLASWGAWFQKPHINAYRIPPSVLSKDFWAYPVEHNAFRRLPVINSSLNDVFVLPDGKQLWAVGDGGLIVHSTDGGFTWQKQTIVTAEQLNQVHISSINPLGQAWAGEPPNQQQLNSANQSTQIIDKAPAKSPVTVQDKAAQTAEQKSPSDTPQAIDQPATTATAQAPKEFNTDLQAVFFTDSNHGWVVGGNGVILATTDGGLHWQLQSSGLTISLTDVYFTDSTHGWAVSGKFPGKTGNSNIIITNDGGKSWKPQFYDAGSLLYCVNFIDSNHGWAVGAGLKTKYSGLILTTSDGGQHWQPQTSGVESLLYAVKFIDTNHGWAVGEKGTILFTNNGGKNWQPQASGVDSDLNDVSFTDASHGWAVGLYGVILTTSNGGQNWQQQASGVGSWLNRVQFSDASHGWVVARDGSILFTINGGENWVLQSAMSSGFYSVQFSDNTNGWAVGGNGIIFATTNGGKSWQRKFSNLEPRYVGENNGDRNHGWAVGRNGANQAIPNGTTFWPPAQYSDIGTILLGVQFIDADHGWVVGENGVILSTNNNGQTWQRQISGTETWLNGIYFFDLRHGWVAGGSGVILETIDGGQSWQRQNSGIDASLWGIYFRDASHGWAVGEKGVIITTFDGGQSWQPQTSGVESLLLAVGFIDTNHGWAVGEKGTILFTNNGGKNWQLQASGVTTWLNGVYFTDANHGWVVSQDGIILNTTDGGQHWQPQASGVKTWLSSVFLNDSTQGWAVGLNGTILSTTDGGQHWRQPEYRRYPAPWIYLPMSFALLLAATALWQLAGQANGEKPQKGITDRAITDKPAGPNSKDLLGARKIAAGLTRFLTNKNTQPPITIAITGEWGSGKSSVMNYLFKGLDRQGLTPVWFNAWHHREEQNVLGSILTNIHKQAIGPWWSLRGAWFRLCLQWQRNRWMKSLLLTLTFALTFSSCWLYSHDKERGQVGHYALYRMGIEKPVLISEKGYELVCPDLTPLGLGIQAEKSDQQSGKSELHKALFGQENCAQLKKLVSEANEHKDVLPCDSDQTNRCFADPDQFLDSVEKQLGLLLTVENEALLLKTIEHLHPDFPVQLSPTVIKWLSALFAVLTLFAFKGMALIGLAPAKVVQGVLSVAGTTPAANEPVGTRVLFEKHFQRITQVLGKRRLVLFIDDLDRCDREHTRQVLEITNFLASAGELFIVLGMAPRYVLANVTLCFQDVAKAVHEADVLNGDGDSSASPQDAGQSWFARHYLQKLIHIEVPVSKPETAQVLAFLKGETDQAGRDLEDVKMEKLEQAEQRLDDIWEFLGNKLAWVFLLAAIIVGGLWGSGQLGVTPTEQITQQSNSAANTKAQPTETQTPTQKIQDPQNREDNKVSGELFKNGANDSNHPVWQILPFIALLLVVVGLFWLSRQPKLLENKWLSWLQPLFHRLKLRLLGPVSGNDSESFADALDIWHELIALTNPTPRNIKAFLNQLRYFASREFSVGTQHDHHEAQLVALASMYYAFGDEMMKTFEFKHSEEKPRLVNLHFKTQIAENAVLAALETALAKHFAKFGAFPSEQDQKLYQALCEDISIQRHD